MELKEKDLEDYYSGKYEVELTDNLITLLVREKKWGDIESLKNFRDAGAKWNTKRNSIVFPTEYI